MLLFFLISLIEVLFFANIRFVKPGKLGADGTEKTESDGEVKSGKGDFHLIESSKKMLSSGLVNFKKDRIQLYFNKEIFTNSTYIKLQSSASGSKLEDLFLVRSESNKLEVLFKKALKKNTTYIITFLNRSVISTDGDLLEDFNLVFSTGEKLDDCVFSGSVVDLFDNSQVPNAYVFMYKLTDDEIKKKISNKNILNSNTPYYFCKCDKFGKFKVNNISKGTYFICAGEIDIDNFVSNAETYCYGFLDDFITFTDGNSDLKDINLYVFKNSISKFKIVGKRILNDEIIIETNGELESFSLKVIDKFANNYSEYNNLLESASRINVEKNNEIMIDNKIVGLISNDILPCFIEITNKFGEKIRDKIDIEFKDMSYVDEYYLNEYNEDDVELSVKPMSDDSTVDAIANFKVISKNNILSVDKEKVKVVLSDKYSLETSEIKGFRVLKDIDCFYIVTDKKVRDLVEDLKNGNDGKYDLLLRSDVDVRIEVQEGAIYYSNFERNKEFFCSVLFLKEYSSVPIEIDLKFKHFRVQLLDRKFSVIKDITDVDTKGSKSFVFEKVPYGEYTIRYFAWNGDVWSPGNIFRNQIHDYINFYDGKIIVKNKIQCDKLFIKE